MSSVPKMIQGLQIMLAEVPRLATATCSFGAEHDEIYFYVDLNEIPEDSAAGQKLIELGFHASSNDAWSMFV